MFPMFFPIPWLSLFSPIMFVQADNWDYHPQTEWGQGDLKVEDKIAATVATPGRQIGIIADAVIELSDKLKELTASLAAQPDLTDETRARLSDLNRRLDPPDSDIARLKRLVEKVESIKREFSSRRLLPPI